MKVVVEVGWPLGLGLIMFGLIWWLVEDIVREGTGRHTSEVGPVIALLGAGVLVAMLFIPASYQPI